jgi:hypothetical protein
MGTPVQEKGIVYGKTYRVGNRVDASAGGVRIKTGSLVVLNEDDGTHLPYFDYVNESGKVLYSRGVVDIYKTDLIAVDADDVDPVDVHVDLNLQSTSIVIQKRLTLDQVAAVLKAAGV